MARRILNRKDLRAAHDAAEARTRTEEEEELDEDEDGDDDDEEEKAEGDADADGEADDEAEGDEDDEDAPVVKKKKAAKVKAPKVAKVAKPRTRTRTAKVVRMRVVWGVFNNSNQCVASYAYPQRAEADAHAAKLTADKRNTHFVQPVKEPIEEKKE